MGAFLYFADNMPGIAKVASFLVRIPGGDLERGVDRSRGGLVAREGEVEEQQEVSSGGDRQSARCRD